MHGVFYLARAALISPERCQVSTAEPRGSRLAGRARVLAAERSDYKLGQRYRSVAGRVRSSEKRHALPVRERRAATGAVDLALKRHRAAKAMRMHLAN